MIAFIRQHTAGHTFSYLYFANSLLAKLLLPFLLLNCYSNHQVRLVSMAPPVGCLSAFACDDDEAAGQEYNNDDQSDGHGSTFVLQPF